MALLTSVPALLIHPCVHNVFVKQCGIATDAEWVSAWELIFQVRASGETELGGAGQTREVELSSYQARDDNILQSWYASELMLPCWQQ